MNAQNDVAVLTEDKLQDKNEEKKGDEKLLQNEMKELADEKGEEIVKDEEDKK